MQATFQMVRDMVDSKNATSDPGLASEISGGKTMAAADYDWRGGFTLIGVPKTIQ